MTRFEKIKTMTIDEIVDYVLIGTVRVLVAVLFVAFVTKW